MNKICAACDKPIATRKAMYPVLWDSIADCDKITVVKICNSCHFVMQRNLFADAQEIKNLLVNSVKNS